MIKCVKRKNLLFVLECAGLDPVLIAQVKELSDEVGRLNKIVDDQKKLLVKQTIRIKDLTFPDRVLT